MENSNPVVPVPEEFRKVMKNLVSDMKTTFPEFIPLIDKWWKEREKFDQGEEGEKKFFEYQEKAMVLLFNHAMKKFPPRFFEILYQNDEMFSEDSPVDTEFLPNIHFKNIWQFDISPKTREIIWKYLQLILFSVAGNIQDNKDFGETTSKLFENIQEGDFQEKLEDTMKNIQNLFDFNASSASASQQQQQQQQQQQTNENTNTNSQTPFHGLEGMLDGKLGKLAKEIAEETANELNMEDFGNPSDMKDVFQGLMKNKGKMMNLVKNIGSKLDSHIKSGDLKESEMLQEATDLLNKMKDMPGMENIEAMLKQMGLGGRNTKVNMGAMEANLKQQVKTAQMKERMRAKAESKQQQNQQNQQTHIQQSNANALTDEQLISLFSEKDKDKSKSALNSKKDKGEKKKKGKANK
jgi:hypothetical protein